MIYNKGTQYRMRIEYLIILTSPLSPPSQGGGAPYYSSEIDFKIRGGQKYVTSTPERKQRILSGKREVLQRTIHHPDADREK